MQDASITHRVMATVTAGFDALPSLQDAWGTLFEARRHEPSTSFEWTSAMVRHHVRPADRGLLIQLHQGDRLVGLVPLVARAVPLFGTAITILTPLSEEYNTHSDLLLRAPDPAILDALVAAISALDMPWDCFRMARLLEGGATAMALRDALARARIAHHTRPGIAAYHLQLPDSYAAYLAGRTSKFRNYLRRTERKLSEAGRLDYCEISDTSTLPDDGLNAMMAVERSSWKHAHGTAISAVGRQASFFTDLCRDAWVRGRLHLQWCTLDGRPVAYNLGYVHAGCYHYLKTSFDQETRALGPSTALRAQLIRRLIERGVREFDFPGEPYEWEAQWTGQVRWRQVVTMYRATVRGRLLRMVERLRHPRAEARIVHHVDPRASGPHPERTS